MINEETLNDNDGGILFGSINYKDDSDVNKFIEFLNLPQSIYVLNKSLEYCNRMGIFSLKESEILSKSLRILESYQINEDPQN